MIVLGDLVTTIQSDYTVAGQYSFTVPSGVSTLTASVWGAGGAGGDQLGATGGGGGYVEASLTVTPGDHLVSGRRWYQSRRRWRIKFHSPRFSLSSYYRWSWRRWCF